MTSVASRAALTSSETNSTRQLFDGWASQSWKLLAMPMLLFLTLPLLALFTKVSIPDLLTTLQQPQVTQAITLSLVTSLATVLITLLFGTPLAYLLAQHNTKFNRFADTLIDLPMVMPPSVAGVALLMAFGRRGLFGPSLSAAGISIPFTMVAVVMAQTFVASSYFVKAAAIGFSGINDELKQAAALDGAGGSQTFRYIVLPLAATALLSGIVMTWARALGEFGATIIFAGNFPGRTQTMPLAIYLGFEIDMKVALTLSVILIGFSFLSLLIVKGILHRKIGNTIDNNTE